MEVDSWETISVIDADVHAFGYCDCDFDCDCDADENVEVIINVQTNFDPIIIAARGTKIGYYERPEHVLHKTKPCINNGKCSRKKCDFYHRESERRFPKCNHGINCYSFVTKSVRCPFSHPGESIEQIRFRIKIPMTPPPPPPPKYPYPDDMPSLCLDDCKSTPPPPPPPKYPHPDDMPSLYLEDCKSTHQDAMPSLCLDEQKLLANCSNEMISFIAQMKAMNIKIIIE